MAKTPRSIQIGSDAILRNSVQDGNVLIKVNDGGVVTDAVTVAGSTSAVTLGTAATSARHFIINGLAGGYALEVENQNDSTGKGLRVYANNSSNGATNFALLVEGASGERLSVRNDGLVNAPNLRAGISYRIRNNPNMTNGVPVSVLDFTGLPPGIYLVCGKRTGVSTATNGLWVIHWTGTVGTFQTTLSSNGITAPTFVGNVNFNVTSTSSTQHYFYAQTLAIDF